jgi:translation initiation factor 5A
MSEEHEEGNFEKGEAGSSHTYPIAAGTIKKGGYCMLGGCPCKVTEYSTSKAGKHGHAKATIVGTDIFTGKKKEDAFPTSHNCEVPFVSKNEFTLVDIAADGFLTLMNEKGDTKEDVKLPVEDEAELCKEIKEAFEGGKEIMISILSAMGKEKVSGWRENNNSK